MKMTKSAFKHSQNQMQHRHPIVPLTRSEEQGRPGNLHPESDRCLRASVKAKATQGDYQGAIVLLTQLIDRHPNSAADYNNRGLIYFQSGEMDLAIADYNTALQLNPHLDNAYNNRANYYAAEGKLAKAIEDYEIALDLNPTNIRAWINQGITFRQMGQYSQALDNFDFALHLGQLAGNIYAERGRTYHLWGDWNCAIADYRRALAHMSPSDATASLRLQVKTWMNHLLTPQYS